MEYGRGALESDGLREVSSTARPSAVESDLEVLRKRRQWVVIEKSAVSGQPSA